MENNVYAMRFRSGLRFYLLNSIANRIPSWTIRKVIYKIFGLKMRDGCRIGLYTIIDYPRGIRIGKNSVINESCFLDGRGGIEIQDNVSISIYTKIISASHRMNDSNFSYYEENVTIEDNVWIGAGAIILNGSKLCEGAVVGAGSVLKGTADRYTVYVGNPACKLKKRKLNENYQLNYRPWMR